MIYDTYYFFCYVWYILIKGFNFSGFGHIHTWRTHCQSWRIHLTTTYHISNLLGYYLLHRTKQHLCYMVCIIRKLGYYLLHRTKQHLCYMVCNIRKQLTTSLHTSCRATSSSIEQTNTQTNRNTNEQKHFLPGHHHPQVGLGARPRIFSPSTPPTGRTRPKTSYKE